MKSLIIVALIAIAVPGGVFAQNYARMKERCEDKEKDPEGLETVKLLPSNPICVYIHGEKVFPVKVSIINKTIAHFDVNTGTEMQAWEFDCSPRLPTCLTLTIPRPQRAKYLKGRRFYYYKQEDGEDQPLIVVGNYCSNGRSRLGVFFGAEPTEVQVEKLIRAYDGSGMKLNYKEITECFDSLRF